MTARPSAATRRHLRPEALPWMIAAIAAGVILRATAWIMLRGALFTGVPGFEDEVHLGRIIRLMHDGFPESVLPAGSPFYPYLAALLGSVSGGGAAGILFLQSLAGLGVVLLIAWACAPLLSPRARWIAALLYAAHPLAVFLELRLQPTVFALLLMLPALRLLFFDARPSLRRFAAGALVLGVGFLFRPLLFFALFAAALVIAIRRFTGPSAAVALPRTRLAPVMLAAFLLLPVLFSAYHATLPGGAAAWNWTDAYLLHRDLRPDTWGTARAVRAPVWEGYSTARMQANETLGRELDEGDALAFYRGRGLQQLVERPLQWLGLVLVRGALLVSRPEVPDPTSAAFVLGRSARALVWGLHLFPLLLALGALGFWSWRGRREAGLVAPVLIAVAAVNLVGTYSLSSRIFLVVALLPLAAEALTRLSHLVSEARSSGAVRLAGAGAGALLVLSALDLPRAARFENPSEDLREASRILRQASDPRAATTLLQQAKHLDPGNAAVRAALGEMLVSENLPAAAREEFRAALASDPDYVNALFGWAEIERGTGSYERADSLMSHLLELHPRNPLYLNQLGTIKLMRGDFAASRRLLAEALRISPGYEVARSNLRAVDDAQKRQSALVLPEEVSQAVDPRLVQLGALAIEAMNTQRMDRADSLTAAGMRDFPDDPLAWYMRGALLLRMGRAAEAVEPLLRLSRAVPGRGMTTTLAAEALLAVGRRQDAIALARENLARAADEINRERIASLLQGLEGR